LLQSSTSELGTVIAEKPLKELPLNGRNFTQLLILPPGTNMKTGVQCIYTNRYPQNNFTEVDYSGDQERLRAEPLLWALCFRCPPGCYIQRRL